MFNKLKQYNSLLELDGMGVRERRESLNGIFQRDFIDTTPSFRAKTVRPTPKEGKEVMDVLLHHLTTCTESKDESSREYDRDRAIRIHWVCHHIYERSADKLDVFSVREKKAIRTYLWDKTERYVVILEPKDDNTYYLITAYYLSGGNWFKIESKSRRRLPEVY